MTEDSTFSFNSKSGWTEWELMREEGACEWKMSQELQSPNGGERSKLSNLSFNFWVVWRIVFNLQQRGRRSEIEKFRLSTAHNSRLHWVTIADRLIISQAHSPLTVDFGWMITWGFWRTKWCSTFPLFSTCLSSLPPDLARSKESLVVAFAVSE